jgi:CheY-like chemotaxis protein
LTNAEGGTGLGLAITKKLVEALGGQISVVSDVGNWTKFTVDFPFTNKLVDIEELSLRLRETTIFLVSDENSVDTKGMEAVFSRFMVDYAHFPTMRDLARVIATEGALSEDGTYVCMVQEDLYDKETYELLTGNARACLVTFGPNFTVEKCLRHYRSLVETFPSVLIQNLGVFAQDLTRDPQRDCSVKSTGTFNNELGALRVLIAEDNLVNQKVLTRILNRLNVTSIAVVGNGLEAVEREAVEEFDLILMDMQMPKMDGIEACIEINQRTGGHPRAKIVFVTAHVSDSFRQTCLENGAFGYLPKPCTLEGVSEVLRHAMGQGSLFSPVYTASWNQNTAPPTS